MNFMSTAEHEILLTTPLPIPVSPPPSFSPPPTGLTPLPVMRSFAKA